MHYSAESGLTTRDSLSSISDSESPVFCFFLSMVSVYRAMTSGERAAVLVAVSFTIVLNALSTAATKAASFLKTLAQICVYLEWRSINLSTYSRGSYVNANNVMLVTDRYISLSVCSEILSVSTLTTLVMLVPKLRMISFPTVVIYFSNDHSKGVMPSSILDSSE